jgi:hypothetical protein
MLLLLLIILLETVTPLGRRKIEANPEVNTSKELGILIESRLRAAVLWLL